MAAAGEIGNRPEARRPDWRRLGTDAEVKALEGLGVYDQRQIPAGRCFRSSWPVASPAMNCPRMVTRNTLT